MGGVKSGTHCNWDKRRPSDRYIRISSGAQRGEYLHRMIAAAKIGRDLFHTECVHHIDGDTTNNHFSNLEILSWHNHGKVTRNKYRKPK
jgi:hypothetical protein